MPRFARNDTVPARCLSDIIPARLSSIDAESGLPFPFVDQAAEGAGLVAGG